MLLSQMAEDGEMQLAVATMAKCTSSCLMSMRENTLLPTEEACLQNCFAKAHDFNANYSDRLTYANR